MPSLLKSHAALFAVQLMYGANYVVAKGLMPEVIGPNGFILLRVTGAVALFWAFCLRQKVVIRRVDFLRLAVCGLFGVALNQLTFFNGLMRTSPLNASVIMTTVPILVTALSAWLLNQKIQLVQLVGIVVGAVGAVLFVLLNAPSGYASKSGDALVVVNATAYALYLLAVKPLLARYPPMVVIRWVFTFGWGYVLLYFPSITECAEVDWAVLTYAVWLQLGFVVVGVTFVPYLFNVYAMKRLSPSLAAVYIYLQPVLATAFAYLFSWLHWVDYTADMRWEKLVCALLVFAGVYLVIRPPKKRARQKVTGEH